VRCGRPGCGRELAALYEQRWAKLGLRALAETRGPPLFLVVVERNGDWGPILDPADPDTYSADLEIRCRRHGMMSVRVADVLLADGDTFRVK